jgi:hypothetical protein
MPRRRKSAAFEHQPGLRALPCIDAALPGHGSFLIMDDATSPHLRVGEYAIVDTTDREPQHGELFLVQSFSGERRRRINQVTSSLCNITGPGAEETLVWWLRRGTSGFRDTGKTVDGVPLFCGLSDGPYETPTVIAKLVGRIVGYSHTAMGDFIAPMLGFAETSFNFDAAEYLDVLIGAGYRPRVSKGLYYEHLPDSILNAREDAAILRVMSLRSRAEGAIERLSSECIRRGLVDR